MKIICEQCKKEGYLQVLGSYYRTRHYSGINAETKKSMFYYHQQSKGYIQSLSREQKLGAGPEPNGKQCSSGQESIDPNLLNPSSLNEKNTRAGSSVRIEHQPPKLVVVGSNPTPPVLAKKLKRISLSSLCCCNNSN